jgi:hypothetical protein
MRALLLLSLLALPALLTACGGGGAGTGTDPSTGATGQGPNYLILAFSGQRANLSLATNNEAYLALEGGVVDLANALAEDGSTVTVWEYASAFFDVDTSGTLVHPWDNASFAQFGFLRAIQNLEVVRDNWIAGQDNPTQVIVVGHDHGAVWAHLALMLIEDVPVQVLIDLDADSTAWGSDSLPGLPARNWNAVMAQWTAQNNAEWPFDVWNAVDAFDIPNAGVLFDAEDVVPTNAITNLELWTDSQLLHDPDENRRFDGSTTGIESLQVFDAHSSMPRSGSESMVFAIPRTLELLGR